MRTTAAVLQLDAIDREILHHLQHDGRVSNVELAQRVHLSPSACLRRVKSLEESGVIARYVALVDPRRVGQPGTSYTIVNLERLTQPAIEAFEGAVRDCPEILDCHYVAGTNDYLLRFVYGDAADLERFHAEVLMRLPGVLRSNSMLVLRTVKKTTAVNLPANRGERQSSRGGAVEGRGYGRPRLDAARPAAPA